jgi:hypothetical protein
MTLFYYVSPTQHYIGPLHILKGNAVASKNWHKVEHFKNLVGAEEILTYTGDDFEGVLLNDRM